MDWIRDHAWESWLLAAIALGSLEIMSADLILIMLAGGAVSSMVVALAGGPFVAQMLVGVGVTVGLLAFLRPGIVARLHAGPTLATGAAALIGQRATVLEALSHVAPGRVKIGGDVWTAQPFDEDDLIEAGSPVEVVSIKGATAYVVRQHTPS